MADTWHPVTHPQLHKSISILPQQISFSQICSLLKLQHSPTFSVLSHPYSPVFKFLFRPDTMHQQNSHFISFTLGIQSHQPLRYSVPDISQSRPPEYGSTQGNITLTVRSNNIIIHIHTIPVISAPPLAKSIAFNNLTSALYHNCHSLTPTDCINALIMNIPVPAASAKAKASHYANIFCHQFLDVKNIILKAFLTKSGKMSTADPLQVIAGHIPHIQYALVESSFNPSAVCHSIMGCHHFASIFANALQITVYNACVEFCLHLPQDTINPFNTTDTNNSDNNFEETSTCNTPYYANPTSPIYQNAPDLPSLVNAWTTALQQEQTAMSTKELHSIIEASFRYNKHMHQQSNPTQDTTIPPPQTILAALSHPGNSHTHATTYRGNFSLAENQDKFNTLLAIDDPCTVVSNPNGGTPTLNHKSVQCTINTIVSSIQYILFRELLFSQYVGKDRSNINSSEFTNDTINQIKHLQLQFTHGGKVTTLTPDDLYIKYISLTHSLPQDAREWHASLPSMFLDTLTPELRAHLCNGDNPYTQPSFNTLTSKFDQESA